MVALHSEMLDAGEDVLMPRATPPEYEEMEHTNLKVATLGLA